MWTRSGMTWPGSWGGRWNQATSRCGSAGRTDRLAQEGGDLGAGRMVLVGREADVRGVGAGFQQRADGTGPAGVRVQVALFAAADGRPDQRVAVPGFVAGFDVGAAIQKQAGRVRRAGVGGGVPGRSARVAAPAGAPQAEGEPQAPA